MDAASATPPTFSWPAIPYPAFVSTFGIALVSCGVLFVSHYFDPTRGLLTISVLIVVSFVATTIVSLIYPEVPQIATTEILIGGLATALGAIVGYWTGRHPH